jgi:formylmethanofuran dehydrogenase subunit E
MSKHTIRENTLPCGVCKQPAPASDARLLVGGVMCRTCYENRLPAVKDKLDTARARSQEE